MLFHAPTGQFTVPASNLDNASHLFRHAIRHIRELAKRPLTPYNRNGELRHEDYAMKGIIDAAKMLGIDLGADWGNELDVTDKD